MESKRHFSGLQLLGKQCHSNVKQNWHNGGQDGVMFPDFLFSASRLLPLFSPEEVEMTVWGHTGPLMWMGPASSSGCHATSSQKAGQDIFSHEKGSHDDIFELLHKEGQPQSYHSSKAHS